MTTGLTRVPSPEPPVRSLATVHEFDVADVIARIVKVQEVMRQAMKEGEHYGVIPGATKPSLLKPGAELLCMVFRLDPQYGVEKTYDGDHLNVDSTCTLYHIPTSLRLGSGVGSCATKEKKYKYRTAKRQCPKCGAEAIFRSKYPPKDKTLGTTKGWYCFDKQGGCGTEFAASDSAILNQPLGQVLNPDLPDLWNTVTKMANKRALIAGVLNVTAASDIFTQDLEDYPEELLPKSSPPLVVASKPLVETLIASMPAAKPTGPHEIVIESFDHFTDVVRDLDTETQDPGDNMVEPAGTRETAPLTEWLMAFARPTKDARSLLTFWRGCIAPDIWLTWTPAERMQLCAAHGAAWDRLLTVAPTVAALQALWKAITPPTGTAIWETWTVEEQAKRIAAKDSAKTRLGVVVA